MNGRTAIASFLKKLDWKLLLFLVLFLNVKLVVKAIALLLIYLLRFNFKWGFSLKHSRLPLFYLFIPGIAIINPALYTDLHTISYAMAFLTGLAFWLAGLLAIHQVKLSVDKNDSQVLYNTVLVFFILNALVSFAQLAAIIIETGALNPYRYQGNYQKYFTGTGDYIKGITFDSCPTNAAISAFGTIFFLLRKHLGMTLLCMTVLLLTMSNLTNSILLLALAYLFVFKSDRLQKSLIVCCCMLLVVCMAILSPQNTRYVQESCQKYLGWPAPGNKVDSIKRNQLPPEVMHRLFPPRKPVVYPSIPKDDIHSIPFQRTYDTTSIQRNWLVFINMHRLGLPLSGSAVRLGKVAGKRIAVQQTIGWLKQHPRQLFMGAGMGNFSSKLAFRTTGLAINGGYPSTFVYINNEFLHNHLDLFLYYFSKEKAFHSVINLPNSVYDQLISEYGLAGLVIFFLCYIGYFWKRRKYLTYGIPLLLILLCLCFSDYWFEQLSVIVVFEYLLFINIKERTIT